MADVHSAIVRSKNMAAIKGTGNKSTDSAFLLILRKNKITGWRRNNKRLPGKPDFIFPNSKVAVFLDGCFWHGCKSCYIPPRTNTKFWQKKLNENIARDKRVNLELISKGWKVERFWEHELPNKNQDKTLKRIYKILPVNRPLLSE